MNDLASILKSVAPTLAKAVLSPAGGAVVSALADKLGVPPDAASVASALSSPEQLEKARQLELEWFKVDQENITQRWVADDQTESWLAKNIRPLTLLYILTAYTFFAVCSMFDLETRGAYVELLGQWGMLIMSAYFGGRTIEKVMGKK